MLNLDDPFQEERRRCPVFVGDCDGEAMPMLLRLKDVRKAALNWLAFSSGKSGSVPIPSEASLRQVRLSPMERDLPEHAEYRKVLEPLFQRPKHPEYQDKLDRVLQRLMNQAVAVDSIDIVPELSMPLQSYALACLLNLDETEAEIWMNWGIHVYKDGDVKAKSKELEDYCRMQLIQEGHAADSFFGMLHQGELNGRKLTTEEKLEFSCMVFVAGRETMIHLVSRIISYFADHPEELKGLRDDPKRIPAAAEEFFRVFTPLTHTARTCSSDVEVAGHPVKQGGRISLVWSAANRDETMFEQPNEIRLDRKPNPHVAFGFGPHHCPGSMHAHAVVHGLLKNLSMTVSKIVVLEKVEQIEREACYARKVGYHKLSVQFKAKNSTD